MFPDEEHLPDEEQALGPTESLRTSSRCDTAHMNVDIVMRVVYYLEIPRPIMATPEHRPPYRTLIVRNRARFSAAASHLGTSYANKKQINYRNTKSR